MKKEWRKCHQIILPSLVVNCPSFRLGVDLDKIFKNGRHPLPASLAGTLAVQVINALEYLHSKGYTHNDIKVLILLCRRSGLLDADPDPDFYIYT